MGLFDKLKNIFTEEVEDEPIKKEVRQVEIPGPVKIEENKDDVVEKKEEKKEEKFVFPVYFDDKDFEELKPKEEKKVEPKKEVYNAKQREIKEVKKFSLSPVISPVYGVLDKNYRADVADKPFVRASYKSTKSISVEDVRKKAFGTLEEELENTFTQSEPTYFEKEEVYIETPIEKVEAQIVDSFVTKEEEKVDENMTLEELNKFDDDKSEDLNIKENDLFDLIDSMYEKSDSDDSK
ncbi:MAG: hypothetical protein PHD02_01940 [Bacilli bacterium]|nr:hypothetical protein [Bacilli bacterium]